MKVEKNNMVYAHISKINHRVYIGKTSQNPEYRWRHGNGYRGEFKADIEKYGWSSFKHIVLAENLDQDAACKLESFYIELFGSDDPEFGYNQTRGGEHYRSWNHSDEARRKISLNHPDFSESNNPYE